jgi:regulator of replication initiation timing
VDSGSVLTHNHVLAQPFAPAVNCEVCLHWIGLYYRDIPILQKKIQALMAQNRSLKIENRELKANSQRQEKHLKKK